MFKTKIILFILASFLVGQAALALDIQQQAQQQQERNGVKELKSNLGDFGKETGLGGEDADLKVRIARIINIVLGFLGVMAVIMIIAAGFKWMMAGGNEQSVTDAKSRLKNAIIGLAIVLAAYVIVGFTVKALTHSIQEAPPGGGGGGGLVTPPGGG